MRQDRRSPSADLTGADIVALSIMSGLAVVATLGFGSTFVSWSFLGSAVLGAVGAGATVAASRRFGLFIGESVALSIFGFVLFGSLATMGVPSPSAYSAFLSGLVDGWSDLLSSAPPTDLSPTQRVLPYTVAWASASIGGELLRGHRSPLFAASGPLAGLVATTLLTVEHTGVARIQGATMTTGAIGLGLVRHVRSNHDSVLGARRWVVSASALVVVGLVAALLGPSLPLAGTNPRFDLRPFQDRPWNPLDQPSPLVTLKASLKTERNDDVVFTVRSDSPISRWSLAVLGDYNGVVWSVADESHDTAAQFQPVDSRFPAAPANIDRSQAVRYEIQLGDLGSVWVPVAGWPRSTAEPQHDLRLNPTTGTVAAPGGIQPGDSLVMESYLRPELTRTELLAATVVTNDADAELALVPPSVRNLAGDLFEGVDSGTARAVELASAFTSEGFYQDDDTARPGHSLARLDEFLADPGRLVGFDEQYASSAGVLARIGGVPTRVVVGYLVPEERFEGGEAAVRADDISAWIEIETEEWGWVPLTVTPDRSREPEAEQLGVTVKDVAIPSPPPLPPPPPMTARNDRHAEEDVTDNPPAEDRDLSSEMAVPMPVLVAGTALGTPLALLSLFSFWVVMAKRRRRRSRQSLPTASKRIQGAWRQLIDAYHEAGVVTRNTATPSEIIAALVTSDPAAADAEAELLLLAEQLDRATFHPLPATDDQASEAWQTCDRAIAELQASRTRGQRLVMRTDPRPLFWPDRFHEQERLHPTNHHTEHGAAMNEVMT